MSQALFHFHAELNDFLPTARRDQQFFYQFDDKVSIKDLIEAIGVPHPEIELLLVNGGAVDFTYSVQDGDLINVYPISSVPQLTSMTRLREGPAAPRFVLDVHLGKLAAYLRMLGFDTLYRNDYDDDELAFISDNEERILLTRDIGLLKRGLVNHGYFMRETNPPKQIVEVLRRYNLFNAIKPLRRCLRCNGIVEDIEKSAVIGRVPLRTSNFYNEFHMCVDCRQIYWQGAHYQRIMGFVEQVMRQAPE